MDVEELVDAFRRNPKGVRFADPAKVRDAYFGEPRQSGGSHRVYQMPWVGDPRVNIQNHRSTKPSAKPLTTPNVTPPSSPTSKGSQSERVSTTFWVGFAS